jgi:phage/plasmid-associated DNA primase
MLLAMDITLFNPRILPENTYLKHIQEDTIDTVQRFVDSVEEGEYTGGDLYRLYKEYCTAEGLYAYTNTKFSMQLLFLKENGSIPLIF